MWNRNKAENNFFDKPVEKIAPERSVERTPTFVAPAPSPTAAPAPLERASAEAKGAVAPALARQPAAPAATAPTKGSVLGATLRFKGDLVADEDLVVQGQVEGSILHSRSLTIGADGGMKGDIRARRIVVEGTVVGDLYALECITVRATGKVRGSLYAPRVAIAEGAEFNGRVDMEHAPTVPAVLGPSVPATAAAEASASAESVRLAAAAGDETPPLDDAAAEVLLNGPG
jgi:cytoskeletal protein CcmA (bactofilin family)